MGWLRNLFGREREDDKSVMSEWEHTEVMYGPPSVIKRFQQERRNMRNRKEQETVLREISNEIPLYGPPSSFCYTNELVLQGVNGEHRGITYVKKQDRITIGRAPDADVCISRSQYISQEHVEINYVEDWGYRSGWEVVCKGRNGLKLDDKKLRQGERAGLTDPALLELPDGQVFRLITKTEK